eukprot:TRINITY_DN15200_c0_g1_i7.p1 TRINITY_DN15200_c0_g1~~TRINITY_DN15200_c0_g1_i7.p1  ORF type:complete len:103 (+),score=13.42 TRINITY_DN15200_c0_g1_i7:168-476(+)
MALLNHQYLFGDTNAVYFFAYMAAIAISYRVFVTQAINDYRVIFIESARMPSDDELGVQKSSAKAFRYAATLGLSVLCVGSFKIGRAVQQECRDRSRMPSSA